MPNRKVILVGHGPVTLRDNDHIATGGEGSVYKSSSLVVKIYTDPKKMVNDDMVEKINRLAQINHPWIIGPRGLVTDERHNPIGYYMPYGDGEALPRFFTNDHRLQVSFGDGDANTLVDGMLTIMNTAHSHNAIMVDANEYGYLVNFSKGKKPEPRILDVDGWWIDRWPAKVIMPSIRDHHTKGFNQGSDYFSWGVVTFQIYTGIHPFKGTLAGYTRNDFTSRMKANASVFSPGVSLNRAVRDFSCIPSRLRDWYEEIFQTTKRNAPPSPFAVGVSTPPKAMVMRISTGSASGALKFEKVFKAPSGDPVRRVFECGIVLLASNALINLENNLRIGVAKTSDCEVIRTATGWMVVERVNGTVSAWFTEGRQDRTDLPINLKTTGIVRFRNRVFAVTDQGLTELNLQIFAKPIISTGKTWQAMTSSAKFYEGMGYQDALGAAFLLLPYDDDKMAYLKVSELDGRVVVNAKAGQRFATVVTLDNQGQYEKFEFAFAKDYSSYTFQKTVVDSPELVVATLPKGVCAMVLEDGELTIMVPSSGAVSKFKDSTIATDEPLFIWNDKVVLVRGGDVWLVSVVAKP